MQARVGGAHLSQDARARLDPIHKHASVVLVLLGTLGTACGAGGRRELGAVVAGAPGCARERRRGRAHLTAAESSPCHL
jgi:hypothetical protein